VNQPKSPEQTRQSPDPAASHGVKPLNAEDYSLYAEYATDILSRHTLDGVFLYISPSCRTQFHCEPEALIGHKFDEFIYPDDLESFRRYIEEIQRSSSEMTISFRGLRKDGTILWLETVGKVLHPDQTGRASEIIAVTRNITERRKVDEAKALLAAIVESSDDSIISSTLEGHIISWNTGAEHLLGYSREEAVGKHITQLVPSSQMDKLPYILEQLKDGKHIERMEVIFQRRDGVRKAILLTVSPIKDSVGQIIGASTIAYDITEIKKAEERLERYAVELERANEEVKQFAYIVSHDLRAPLINLKGFAAELRSALDVLDSAFLEAMPHLSKDLRQSAEMSLKEDIPESLDYIDSSASRMDYFVNAVLRLSRLGRREMIFEPLNLESIVNSVQKGLAHQIEEKQIKITVNPLPEVMGDRTSIEQIVANILTNAVLYLDPARPGRIEIGGEKLDDETIFYIRDNGCGIAEEDMSKVFAPFRRAGRYDVKGEGLGLAYAQTLAYRHGGSIRCKSTKNEGATFTVTLSNHPE
jgi:PAS domain S-box-containing protein